MIKYWIKLWSINDNLYEDAIELINKWEFDFIELYIVPEKINKNKLKILKDSNVQISFHSPHSWHWFNPIDEYNNSEEIWNLVKEYIDYLNPFQIVMHPEFWRDIDTLQKRLSFFNDNRIIIENMPIISSIYENVVFYWSDINDIKKIKTFSSKFCFDFAKAKSSALTQKLNIIEFSNNLIELMDPIYFHISWFLWKTQVDEHFDLWEWDKKLMKYMKNKLVDISEKKDINIVFECKKKDWILNDLKNLEYFKEI